MAGSTIKKYATLGGTVFVGSRGYAFTTAHTFAANLVEIDLPDFDVESVASTTSETDPDETLAESEENLPDAEQELPFGTDYRE